jgi:Protein of unknown function with PCYCGC motif
MTAMKRLLASLCIAFFSLYSSAQWLGKPMDIPAYHTTPPKKGEKLPPIMPAAQLNVPESKYKAVQQHSYVIAAKIPKVLYQQPCYCYCDRSKGHASLHSCFESAHGGECSTCMKELFYSYLMTQQKKTPTQIRQGIVAGEWQSVDLEMASTIN